MSSRRSVAAGRSCLECRRRKIKCDRAYPCSYCIKTKTNCAYPAVKSTTNTDDDVAARLAIVEQRMTSFESDLSEIKQLLRSIDTSVPSHRGSTRDDIVPLERQEHIEGGEYIAMAPNVGLCSTPWLYSDMLKHTQNTSINDISASTCSSNNLGEDERSPTDALPDVFGNGEQTDVLHPSAQTISFLWWKYLEVVDPVCKVLHTTTIQKLVVDAIRGRKILTAGQNCLLFSIYYSSVVAMSAAECHKEVEEERQVLLKRYGTHIIH